MANYPAINETMHTYKQVTGYLGCDAGVPNS